jgi:hypothetical protein
VYRLLLFGDDERSLPVPALVFLTPAAKFLTLPAKLPAPPHLMLIEAGADLGGKEKSVPDTSQCCYRGFVNISGQDLVHHMAMDIGQPAIYPVVADA